MEIDIHTTIKWFMGVLIAFLAFIIFSLGKNSYSTRIFSSILALAAMWNFADSINILTVYNSQIYIIIANIFIRLSYFLSVLIASVFVIFSYSYPKEKRIKGVNFLILATVTIILGYMILGTNIIVGNPTVNTKFNFFIWDYGQLWFIFDAYIISCWIFGISLIYNKLKETEDIRLRKHLTYLIFILLSGIIPPLIFSTFLTRVGIFKYEWLSSISGLLWFIIIAYAIAKHNLFNIRVFAVQLGVYSLWITVGIRLFIAESKHEVILGSIFMATTIIMGILLIRSTITSIKQKEQIEILTKELGRTHPSMQ